MSKIFNLTQAQEQPPGQVKDWLYNTLDVTGTLEVGQNLLAKLAERPDKERVYAFERALQAPAMAMMLRGIPVDMELRKKLIHDVKKEHTHYVGLFRTMEGVASVWDGKELETGICSVRRVASGKNKGKPGHHKWSTADKEEDRSCECCGLPRFKPKAFEPGSDDQVKHLFYGLYKIQPMYNKKKEISVDDDVLDRMGKKYPKVLHITEAIREVRDRVKQLGTLNTRLGPDNRWYSSFNVGAAWTGRFSSSRSPFGYGSNAQNLAERHRRILTSDPGYDIGYLDLKQAESNVVAHLADDETYIEAHKSGDVHTYVTRLVWPGMSWTGDLKQDKKIAKQLPEWDNVIGHDFRFQSKRIQHGSNFGLTPGGIAMIAHIPYQEAVKAQAAYFKAFPKIRAWQNEIGASVRAHEELVNLVGRVISLFGRPWDEHTIKQGLSFKPQSTVADILDAAMWRVWYSMDPFELQLFGQIHDAMLLQYQSGRIDIIRKAAALMKIEVPVRGRIMVIEPEIAGGKNWGHRSKDNPDGIEEIELE